MVANIDATKWLRKELREKSFEGVRKESWTYRMDTADGTALTLNTLRSDKPSPLQIQGTRMQTRLKI